MKKLLSLLFAVTFIFSSCDLSLDINNGHDGSGDSDSDTPVIESQRITRVDLNYSNGEPGILSFIGYDSENLIDRVTFVMSDGVCADNYPYRLDYHVTRNSASLDFGFDYTETVYSCESSLSRYSGIEYPVSYDTFSESITADVNNDGNIVAFEGLEDDSMGIHDFWSTYDENGNLLALDAANDSGFTLEWDEDGNISRYHRDGGENISDVDFTYTAYESPDLGLYLLFLLLDEEIHDNTVFSLFYGNSPTNLPAAVKISDNNGHNITKNITYEFSGDKLIKMNIEALEDDYSYSYSIVFHYDSQNPESILMTPLLSSQKIISDETLSS